MADRIIIRSLSLQYAAGTPRVLSSFSLDIPEGTCCAILGPTGAGKSTLLQCLAGTMRKHHPECVASGSIQIGVKDFQGLPDHVLFPTVGLALQDPHVQISGVRERVFDEVLFTLENTGQVPQDPDAVISPLLRKLGIGHLADCKPTTLSGGETQRVALATILVARPSVLLLDEPTTAMDLSAQDKLKAILREMKHRTTILLTDTQLDFAFGICDQIIILDGGSIAFDGTTGAFLRRLEEFKALLPLEDWIPLKEHLVELLDASTSSHIARALGIA